MQSWRVFTQSVTDGAGNHETDTECTVRLTAKGQSQRVVGEGNGPVNALDHAVRNALLPAYPAVEKFELIDYRVRILDQGHGTDATVRVLIQTTDGRRAWTTVGVGQNIVEASWEALCDAYLYGLIHASEPRQDTAAVPTAAAAARLTVRVASQRLDRRPLGVARRPGAPWSASRCAAAAVPAPTSAPSTTTWISCSVSSVADLRAVGACGRC